MHTRIKITTSTIVESNSEANNNSLISSKCKSFSLIKFKKPSKKIYSLVPPWSLVLIVLMVFLIILCCVYLLVRKLCKKIFKRGDGGFKGSLDLKSMPLLGKTFQNDKVNYF